MVFGRVKKGKACRKKNKTKEIRRREICYLWIKWIFLNVSILANDKICMKGKGNEFLGISLQHEGKQIWYIILLYILVLHMWVHIFALLIPRCPKTSGTVDFQYFTIRKCLHVLISSDKTISSEKNTKITEFGWVVLILWSF